MTVYDRSNFSGKDRLGHMEDSLVELTAGVGTVQNTTATSLTPNAAVANIFKLSSSSNPTFNNPTNPTVGQIIVLIHASTSGTQTASFDTQYKAGGGAGSAIAVNKQRAYTFLWDGTNWVELYRTSADV